MTSALNIATGTVYRSEVADDASSPSYATKIASITALLKTTVSDIAVCPLQFSLYDNSFSPSPHNKYAKIDTNGDTMEAVLSKTTYKQSDVTSNEYKELKIRV